MSNRSSGLPLERAIYRLTGRGISLNPDNTISLAPEQAEGPSRSRPDSSSSRAPPPTLAATLSRFAAWSILIVFPSVAGPISPRSRRCPAWGRDPLSAIPAHLDSHGRTGPGGAERWFRPSRSSSATTPAVSPPRLGRRSRATALLGRPHRSALRSHPSTTTSPPTSPSQQGLGRRLDHARQRHRPVRLPRVSHPRRLRGSEPVAIISGDFDGDGDSTSPSPTKAPTPSGSSRTTVGGVHSFDHQPCSGCGNSPADARRWLLRRRRQPRPRGRAWAAVKSRSCSTTAAEASPPPPGSPVTTGAARPVSLEICRPEQRTRFPTWL